MLRSNSSILLPISSSKNKNKKKNGNSLVKEKISDALEKAIDFDSFQKDISIDDLVRHGLELVLHLLQGDLNEIGELLDVLGIAGHDSTISTQISRR